MNRSLRILTTTGAFLVGVVFSGIATAGSWQLLARILPVERETVTLVDWDRVESSGMPPWGSNSGASCFFELADEADKVDRISVPNAAWKKRFQFSDSTNLRLERSQLGGLPVALSDYDRGFSNFIPKGGVLEKILEGTREEIPDSEPSTRIELLLPLPGTIVTALLGIGIWSFVTTRLWISPRGNQKAGLEKLAFALGSGVGLIGVIAWLG